MKNLILTICLVAYSQISIADDLKLKGKEAIEQDVFNKSGNKIKKYNKSLSSNDKDFEKKAGEAAKELQDILAAKLLSAMYEGVKPDKVFGGGSSEEIYQSLLNEERAKYIDLGLVEPLKKQIINLKKRKGVIKNVKKQSLAN